MITIPPTKTAIIRIRITPDEKASFERAAQSEGVSLSVWMRAVCAGALLQDEVTPTGSRISFHGMDGPK